MRPARIFFLFNCQTPVEYISLFADLECLTTDNFEDILLDLGAEHPQMKAFLMKYKEEHLEKSDFFGKLSLDL